MNMSYKFLKISEVVYPTPVMRMLQGGEYGITVVVENIRQPIFKFLDRPLNCVVVIDSKHPDGSTSVSQSVVTPVPTGAKVPFMVIIKVPPLINVPPPWVDNHRITVYWARYFTKSAQDARTISTEKVT